MIPLIIYHNQNKHKHHQILLTAAVNDSVTQIAIDMNAALKLVNLDQESIIIHVHTEHTEKAVFLLPVIKNQPSPPNARSPIIQTTTSNLNPIINANED